MLDALVVHNYLKATYAETTFQETEICPEDLRRRKGKEMASTDRRY